MELRDVETFLALAEELHFGRASARLHVTQGRVSQTIEALEREVGGALFERTSRMVRLTPLGERFQAGVRTAHDQLMRTLRDCQGVARGVTGQLRIMYPLTIGVEFVTRIVSAFETRYPQCQVIINAAAVPRELRPAFTQPNGAAEIVLSWSPDGDGHLLRNAGVVVGPVLAEESRAVVVPAEHPLAKFATVSVADLADFELLRSGLTPPGIGTAWGPLVTPSGRPIKQSADTVFTMTGKTEVVVEDALSLVARGRGLHLSIESVLERFPFPGLVAVPVRDLPRMVVVPIWLAAAENAVIRAFVEVAVAHCE